MPFMAYHFLLILLRVLYLMNEGQQANYLSTVAHRFRRVLFLCELESATKEFKRW